MALPNPSSCSPHRTPSRRRALPLPEAQLDRFLLKIEIRYPSVKEEVDVVLRTTINQTGQQLPLRERQAVSERAFRLGLQQIAARQRVDDSVVDYAVRYRDVQRANGPGLQSARAHAARLRWFAQLAWSP